MVEEDILLVKSIGSIGKNQPTPLTFDVESLHMHVTAIDLTVAIHFFVVATSFVELKIQ
jgi:hypothetical protein